MNTCNTRCTISRGRALELTVIHKAIFLIPSFVKQRMLQTINSKLVITFPSKAAEREAISNKKAKLIDKVNAMYEAEIDKRTTNSSIIAKLEVGAIGYADKRETCLLDELRFSWFQYSRYIESLGIRAATSEIAIGNIATELPTAEWNNAINQFERSIHEGILMLNSDGSDMKFVTRNFSSAVDLTNIFKEHFLVVAGMPEEILFGKSSSGTVFGDKVPVQLYSVNILIETLAIYWVELVPELADYYDFVSVDTWLGR